MDSFQTHGEIELLKKTHWIPTNQVGIQLDSHKPRGRNSIGFPLGLCALGGFPQAKMPRKNLTGRAKGESNWIPPSSAAHRPRGNPIGFPQAQLRTSQWGINWSPPSSAAHKSRQNPIGFPQAQLHTSQGRSKLDSLKVSCTQAKRESNWIPPSSAARKPRGSPMY